MHKPLLGALTSQRAVSEQSVDDLKSNEHSEITNLDFVNRYRNRSFSKTTENDLEAVFLVLQTRCTKSWTSAFEMRAKELHKKFTILKNGSTAMFIDPDQKHDEVKTDEYEVQKLMCVPES